MVIRNCPGCSIDHIEAYIKSMLEGSLHLKRIESLSNAVQGVMKGTSLAVSAIGLALAQAQGLKTKHAVKQVDRLMSNTGVKVWDLFAHMAPEIIGARKCIVVAMDWTDYDADGQATLALNMITGHGRSSPLLWLTVWKDELKNKRNDFEDACLVRLSEIIPDGVSVTILADRGFGDTKLFQFLSELNFSYVIRFKGNTTVSAEDGVTKLASEWVGKGGRARKLKGARIAAIGCKVGAVVCVHSKGMSEAWCLATSISRASAREIVQLYGQRWTIETVFRDTKDLRFGMGLSENHISEPTRRDRILLVCALAINLLTLLGAAGESLGMDRHLKVNTTTRRTHSLFRQGCMLFDLIPNMPEIWLLPLMARFEEYLQRFRVFACVYTTQ